MGKFLESKAFVVISTVVTLVIGIIAGVLLGYQPNVTGTVSGFTGSGYGSTKGQTSTEYVFQFKTACGYWLLALLITLVVLFLCITIRKLYLNHKTNTESEK